MKHLLALLVLVLVVCVADARPPRVRVCTGAGCAVVVAPVVVAPIPPACGNCPCEGQDRCSAACGCDTRVKVRFFFRLGW